MSLLDYIVNFVNSVRPTESTSLFPPIQVFHVALGHQNGINLASPAHSTHLYSAYSTILTVFGGRPTETRLERKLPAITAQNARQLPCEGEALILWSHDYDFHVDMTYQLLLFVGMNRNVRQ